jgi:peptide chain release factor 2
MPTYEDLETIAKQDIVRVESVKQIFNLDLLKKQIEELEYHISRPEVLKDQEKYRNLCKEYSQKTEELASNTAILEAKEWIQTLLEEKQLVEDEVNSFHSRVEALEESILLSQKDDSRDAYVEINAGAGGVDACDFAESLMVMFLKWASKKGYGFDIVGQLFDDVAGIKSVVLEIRGRNAYGLLKGQTGVHRIKRVSRFSPQGKRETSFASVSVTPIFDDASIEVKIQEKDLEIQTFRSGGKGGQNVNKVESAVRVIHIPSGVAVVCRTERDQLKNKRNALAMLQAKLNQLEQDKLDAAQAEAEANKRDISFGHQVITYSTSPLTYVKDERTGYQEFSVDAVWSGNFDSFTKKYLEWLNQSRHS